MAVNNGTPDWERPFCGVDTTIALVNQGINLNQLNSRGETILHHWIEEAYHSDEITEEEIMTVVQLLVDRGADLNARDLFGFTPILKAAELSTLAIFQLLLQRDEIDRLDKIDALELAGARLLLSYEPEKAFHYWREALNLRNKEGQEPIIKIPLQKTSGQAVEWVTSEQLEHVIQNKHLFWIQGMVTRLRIYADRSCEAVIRFIDSEFSPFFVLDGDDYFGVDEQPTMTHYSDLWIEILGVFLRFKPFGSTLSELTKRLVDDLTWNYSGLEMDDPFFQSELEKINTTLQLILEADPVERLIPHCGFFAMLARLPDVLQHNDIKKYASQLVRLDDGTLLALAHQNQDWETHGLLLQLEAGTSDQQ